MSSIYLGYTLIIEPQFMYYPHIRKLYKTIIRFQSGTQRHLILTQSRTYPFSSSLRQRTLNLTLTPVLSLSGDVHLWQNKDLMLSLHIDFVLFFAESHELVYTVWDWLLWRTIITRAFNINSLNTYLTFMNILQASLLLPTCTTSIFIHFYYYSKIK